MSKYIPPKVVPPEAELLPFFLKPEPGEDAVFSMTRCSPVTDGFYFYNGTLVILNPFEVVWESPILGRSTRSLDEHIAFIQENNIEKVIVVAESISFLTRCPSIRSVQVIPAYSASSFDYSPLYEMPQLRELNCQTVYGPKSNLKAEIDYSHFPELHTLYASGAKGHKNLSSPKGIRKLLLSQGQPDSKTLADFDLSEVRQLDICQSPLRSMHGIEDAQKLYTLSLSYCRSLEDLSALTSLDASLTSLEIQSCGKIKDFSWLSSLKNLESLTLYGSNSLPDLSFLQQMPCLRSFRFTMNVLDGDLTPCLRLKYAYCKNRKHYNLKDSDLPK